MALKENPGGAKSARPWDCGSGSDERYIFWLFCSHFTWADPKIVLLISCPWLEYSFG